MISWEASLTPPQDWDEFVLKNTGCVFHGTPWSKTLEEGYSSKTLYIYGREDGSIRAGISGTLFYFIFFRIFFSLMPYGGIIGDPEAAAELIRVMESQLKKYHVHQARITRVARYPFPPLDGYREQPAFGHCLDLQGKNPESLWTEYRKNNRRDINKAVRSGVSISEGRSIEDFEIYGKLYDETMARNRSLRFYTRNFYESIRKKWIEEGKASILFAEYQSKKIAGILLIDGHDTSYLLGSVSSSEFLKLCPNDLLIHEALLRALKNGRRYFDFMMSSKEDKALIQFKEKWGAVASSFSTCEKDLSVSRAVLWRLLWKLSTSKLGVLLVPCWENVKSWFRK